MNDISESAVYKIVYTDRENIAEFSQHFYARFGASLFPVSVTAFYDFELFRDLFLSH